jgi:Tripartite tricarboxylate transporter TctB family
MNRRTDMISGLVLAIVALILLFVIIPQHTSPPQSENNLSPAFMPTVAVVAMLAMACILMLTAWYRTPSKIDELHEEFGAEAHGVGLADLVDVMIWCVFAVAMMVGFETIGFLATSIPALLLMMLYARQRNLLAIAAVAVIIPVVIQQIALHAFSVQLP